MDCGPGVLARLRSSNGTGWPHVDAIAITHFHLDHWGDLVPWVWGRCGGSARTTRSRSCGCRLAAARRLAAFGTRFGTPDMFVRVFEPKEYAEGEEFEAAG
jgi:ribonuclease BN (tRNA processing enzyme)